MKAGGSSAAAGTDAQRVGSVRPAANPATTRAAPAWPISTTSIRRRRTSARVVAAIASVRRPSFVAPRSPSRSSRRGSPPPAAGEGAITVGPGRSGRNRASVRPPGAARPPASTVTRSGRRSVAAATRMPRSGMSERSSPPGGSEAPASTAVTRGSARAVATGRIAAPSRASARTRQPAEAAMATRGASTRSVAATTAISGARVVAHSTRGRSAADPGPAMPNRSASSGSPWARRRRRRSMTAPVSTAAGAAVAPRSRHVPSMRATRDAATVALPRSRATKARGSLLTRSILPPIESVSGWPRAPGRLAGRRPGGTGLVAD